MGDSSVEPTPRATSAALPSPALPRARLAIVAAALLWSMSGLFAKATIFDDWPSEQRGLILAFWRALFGGLVLLPFARTPRFRPALVPFTLTFAVMNIAYMNALVLTTAANAIWLQMTAPAWVMLVGVMFLRERPSRIELLQLVLSLSGVAVILSFSAKDTHSQPDNHIGIALALISGLTYAGVVMFLRRLRDENSAWLIALNLLVTAAVLFPYVAYLALVDGQLPTPTQLGVLACFGVFQMGAPYLLFAYGLKRVPSQEAAGLALLEPILMPLWVALAWDEQPTKSTIVGAILILAGLAVRYVPRQSSAVTPATPPP